MKHIDEMLLHGGIVVDPIYYVSLCAHLGIATMAFEDMVGEVIG